jgi:hypothetical protein
MKKKREEILMGQDHQGKEQKKDEPINLRGGRDSS